MYSQVNPLISTITTRLSAGQSKKGFRQCDLCTRFRQCYLCTRDPTPTFKHLYPTFDLNAHSASFNQKCQCLTILCWEVFPRSLWVIPQITKIHFTGYINYQEFCFIFIAIKQLNLNIKKMQK